MTRYSLFYLSELYIYEILNSMPMKPLIKVFLLPTLFCQSLLFLPSDVAYLNNKKGTEK